MKTAQELYCHACEGYVRFSLDLSIDGNYKLICPKCGHDHYRVVRKGKITDERWGQSASQQWQVIGCSYSYTSFSASTASSSYTYIAWADSSANSGTW